MLINNNVVKDKPVKHEINDKSSYNKASKSKSSNSKQSNNTPIKDQRKQSTMIDEKSSHDNNHIWYTTTNKNEKMLTKHDDKDKPSTSASDHVGDDKKNEKQSPSVAATAVKLVDMNKITVDNLSDIPLSSYGNLVNDFGENQNHPISSSSTVTKNSNNFVVVNKTGDHLKDFILEHLPAERVANKTTNNIILRPDKKADSVRGAKTKSSGEAKNINVKLNGHINDSNNLNNNLTKVDARTKSITTNNQTSKFKINSFQQNHKQLSSNYLPNKMYSSGFQLSPLSFAGYTQYQRSGNFYYNGQYQLPSMSLQGNRQPFQRQTFNYWNRFPQQQYPVATIPLVTPKLSNFYSPLPSSYFPVIQVPSPVTGKMRNFPSVIFGGKEKTKRGIFPFPHLVEVMSKEEHNNNDDSRPHKETRDDVKTDRMLTHFFEKQISKNP